MFQYMLIGYDQIWRDWTSSTSAAYANLWEGDYEFKLRSMSMDNTISSIASFQFTMLAPWYRTFWAYAMYILMGILTIWAFVRWRLQAVLKRNLVLEHKVLERTKELELQKAQIKSQNDEIINQNESLQQLNNEKNYLLGTVAHDLKNPLNSIYSIAQILQIKRSLQQSERDKYIEQVGVIAEKLNNTVTDLLDTTTLEAGKLEVQLINAPLADLVGEIVARFYAIAEQKAITLTVQEHNAQSRACFDEHLLTKSIENIIDNAIKYTPKGGNVWVSLAYMEDCTSISITDNGPGLSVEDQAKLFNRYTTLSPVPTGKEKSTGLGLSIVKKYVESMSGHVYCKSRLGEGTTFTIKLPKSESGIHE